MKLMIFALFAVLATASAVREKRGYLDFPAYGPPPIYHAPVIAKPMATSYSHFRSETVSHPVVAPVLGYGHSYGYGHPYGFGHSYGYGRPYGFGHSYGYGRPYGFGHSYGYGRPYGYGHSYGYGHPYGYGGYH